MTYAEKALKLFQKGRDSHQPAGWICYTFLPEHIVVIEAALKAQGEPDTAEYQRGYADGKNHYCKIANKNMEGINPEDCPESLFVDGCGNGTYSGEADERHVIEYIRKQEKPVEVKIEEAYTAVTGYAYQDGWVDLYLATLRVLAKKFPNGLKIIAGVES